MAAKPKHGKCSVGPSQAEIRSDIYQQLSQVFQAKRTVIDEIVRYAVLNESTSCSRSILLVRASQCFGVPYYKTIHLGAAIEALQSATLVIDDRHDRTIHRRGRRAVHERYSNIAEFVELAVHDIINSAEDSVRSYPAYSSDQVRSILHQFARTKGRLIRGQIADYIPKQKDRVSLDKLLKINVEKTASFFECCAVSGGILGNATEAEIKLLERFGRAYGARYQLEDDLGDIEEDRREGKATPVTFFGPIAAREHIRQYTTELENVCKALRRTRNSKPLEHYMTEIK